MSVLVKLLTTLLSRAAAVAATVVIPLLVAAAARVVFEPLQAHLLPFSLIRLPLVPKAAVVLPGPIQLLLQRHLRAVAGAVGVMERLEVLAAVAVMAALATLAALAQQGKETTAALLEPRLEAALAAVARALWAHQ